MQKNPRLSKNTAVHLELNGRTVLFGIGGVALVWLFLQLWPILLVILGALMIVGTLAPIVTLLERRGMGRGMRRGYAITIVFSGLFIVIGILSVLTIPRLIEQSSQLVQKLPGMQAQFIERLEKTQLGAPLAKSLRETKTAELFSDVGRLGFTYSSRIVEIAAYLISALFLAMYLIVDRDRMRGGLFLMIPRHHHVRASRILLNLETIVGGYMRGQIITSVMMGVFAFVVLSVARVPNALALALFAGMVDVLPYIGGFLVCVPAFLAALPRGNTVAIVVLALLIGYQEFESRIFVPRIYGKVLRLPAAIVMVALLVGGKLLGIVGVLLALPIAAGIRMVVEELRVELPGEDLPDPQLKERDEEEEREFELRAAGTTAIEAAAIASEIAEARLTHDAAETQLAAEIAASTRPPAPDGNHDH